MRPIDHRLLLAAEQGDLPTIQQLVSRTLEQRSQASFRWTRWVPSQRKSLPNFHVLKPARVPRREHRAWAGSATVGHDRGAFDILLLPYALPGRPAEEPARRQVDIHLTPLVLAVRGHHLECVKALLPHSPLEIQSLDGFDALVMACDQDFVSAVEAILIEAARREELHTLNLKLAVRTCIERGHTRSLQILLRLGDLSANILLDAFHLATSERQLGAVRLLIGHCARLATALHPDHGTTALMNACRHGDVAATSLLIPCGKLDRRNAQGRTALGLAMESQQWGCVELLCAGMTPKEIIANLGPHNRLLASAAPGCFAQFEHSLLAHTLDQPRAASHLTRSASAVGDPRSSTAASTSRPPLPLSLHPRADALSSRCARRL